MKRTATAVCNGVPFNDLQKKIIPLFHYSLNDEGVLLLGTSESIGEYGNLFSGFDSKIKIYKKRGLHK